jgi:hypothetical protein
MFAIYRLFLSCFPLVCITFKTLQIQLAKPGSLTDFVQRPKHVHFILFSCVGVPRLRDFYSRMPCGFR